MQSQRKIRELPREQGAPSEERALDVIERFRRNMATIETMIAKLGFMLNEPESVTARRFARRTVSLDSD